MADIRTSISVQDGLSNAFHSMTKAIEQTNMAFEAVQANLGSGVNSSGINKVTNAQNDLNDELSRGDGIAKNFKNSLLGIGAAIVGAFGAREVLQASDALVGNAARLNLVNDGLETQEQLQQRIFDSAQRTGTAYGDVVSTVAQLNARAGDTFASNAEAIEFAEILNKLYSIAGTSAVNAQQSTTQLLQALGSGALRGEELNAVFESAPNLVQTIADSLNVPIGSIKELASEGKITADVIKNALMGAADDINTQFESLPFTSGEIWTKFTNAATFAFADVLTSINDTLNGERFSSFVASSINILGTLAAVVTATYNTLSSIGAFLYDNWNILAPIFIGVGTALGLLAARASLMMVATYGMAAAQWVYNAAVAASPLTWALLAIGAIIGIIYGAIAAYNHFAGTTVSATGVIVGALAVAGAFVGNIFVGLYNGILDVVEGVYNVFATLAEFFANVFQDPLGSALRVFVGFADSALSIVKSVATALDAVFGSDLGGTLNSFQDRIHAAADEPLGEAPNKIKRFDASQYHLDRYEYGAAYDAGKQLGSNFSLGPVQGPPEASNPAAALAAQLANLNSGIGAVEENTGRTADAVEVSKEDLKYLRDSANQSAINRFTTASISVDMQNNNTINSGLDLDGIVDQLAVGVEEAMNTIASGV